VVKATTVLDVAAKASAVNKISYPSGKVWRTARIVPEPVEFRGEPVKIMDRFGRFCGVNSRS
jgi:hypothetical protein